MSSLEDKAITPSDGRRNKGEGLDLVENSRNVAWETRLNRRVQNSKSGRAASPDNVDET